MDAGTEEAALRVVSVEREDAPRCGACGNPKRAPFYPPGDIVECSECGVLYVSPRPTAAAISAFYSAQGHYDHWDADTGRKAMWRRRVARIRQLVPNGRLLDVGAGQGDFGATARTFYEVDGTEVSSEGARLAHERHGLDIHLGDVCAIDLPLSAYDVVTLWHVLEHVAEPMTLIKRCYDLLKPGGVVCVAVPNTDENLRLTRAKRKTGFRGAGGAVVASGIRLPRLELARPTEEVHLTHFALDTLKSLLIQQGFALIEEGLDDHSAAAGLTARIKHLSYAWFHRMTGLAAAPCLFVAGRKP